MRIIHVAGIVLVLALMASCASAPDPVPEPPPPPPPPTWPQGEAFRTAEPAPGPTPALEVPAVERFTLEGGVDVMLVNRPALPVVAMEWLFPVGSAKDPKGREGLAEISMGMLGQGTKELDKAAFEARKADLASEIGTWASVDESGVRVQSLKRNLAPTLDLTLAMLRSPGSRKPDLVRLKKARQASIVQARAVPANAAPRVFYHQLYGKGHARGRLETEATIDKIKLPDVGRFLKGLGPKGSTLMVVGDVTRAELEELLTPRMKGWKGGGSPIKVKNPRKIASGLYLVHIPGAAQSQITMGHLGPERSAADYEATMLMSRILGGGFSSRINMNLRERQGVAYGARAGFSYTREGSVFWASSSVRTDATGLALREIALEIDAMRKADPKAEELAREKEGSLLSLPARFTTARSLLGTFRELYQHGLPLDYHEGYSKRLEAVELPALGQAARQHLQDSGLVVVVAGDADVIGPQLEEVVKGGYFGIQTITRVTADAEVIKPPKANARAAREKAPREKAPKGEKPAEKAPKGEQAAEKAPKEEKPAEAPAKAPASAPASAPAKAPKEEKPAKAPASAPASQP